jgi:hypothetical protein
MTDVVFDIGPTTMHHEHQHKKCLSTQNNPSPGLPRPGLCRVKAM